MSVETEPGETVLWEGRPSLVPYGLNASVLFFFSFLLLVPVSLVLTAPTPSPAMPSPLFFALPFLFFNVLFVGPGIVGVLLEGSRTSYTVTDRRVLIRAFRHRAEIDLSTLQFLELERSVLGTWTISFGPRWPYEGWSWLGGRWTPALRAIRDGDRVYEIVSRARARYRQR